MLKSARIAVALAAGALMIYYLFWPETVDVKYRGPVSLATFHCQVVSRSSFIQRVCYDASQSYMLIRMNGSYYRYCEIDQPGGCDDVRPIHGAILQPERQR